MADYDLYLLKTLPEKVMKIITSLVDLYAQLYS